jgi:hypothetical protein
MADVYTVTVKIAGDTAEGAKVVEQLQQIASTSENTTVRVMRSQQQVQQAVNNSARAYQQNVATHTQYVNSLGMQVAALNPAIAMMERYSAGVIAATQNMGPFFAGTNSMALGLQNVMTRMQNFTQFTKSDSSKVAMVAQA